MSVIQPTRCTLLECTIGGMPFRELTSGGVRNNFHVQEMRIFEDNCKFYFTAQLMIEAHLNSFELYVTPQARVTISFAAPPTEFIYTETFRIYSYESKPRQGDIQNAMIITISLMGDEYFRDKASKVQRNFKNVTATRAIQEIHSAYIASNGGLKIPQESVGLIGMDNHAHQVINKNPSKAIHDLLDKAVFPVSSSGPGIYYRDKPGYMVAAIEYLIATQPITGHFIHEPAQGASLAATLGGYDRVIHFRPMAPPGEDRGGGRGGEIEGAVSALTSVDMAEGNNNMPSSFAGVQKAAIDAFRQFPNIDKNGPGGFKAREDAFITRLTYSPKYWTSVPLQTGIKVTVGNRISVRYPIGIHPEPVYTTKILWVPRLIHELRFTEGENREDVTINGTTDIFGVFLT